MVRTMTDRITYFHLFCGLGAGKTFMLSATPVWVRPVAVAISVRTV